MGGVCNDGAWQCGGDFGLWMLQHTKPRRHLETPCNIKHGRAEPQTIASMRLARGTFASDNTPSTTHDRWRNSESANLDVLGHWIGTQLS